MNQQQTAVITGGAGGLGKALTARLIDEGWFVVVIDLPGPQLDQLCSDKAATMITAHACDLTDWQSVEQVCTQIITERPTIDLVIYNAGVTQLQPFGETQPATHRQIMDINYFGAIIVARHFLQALRMSQGTHLAISSVAGFAPLVNRTAYAASKHAMEGFFNTLRAEETPFGVHVLIAAPSFIATNAGGIADTPDGIARPGSATDAIDSMLADEAARIIVAGFHRKTRHILVGRIAKLAWLINRCSPTLYAYLMRRKIGQDQSKS